jgi:hypothetical protein
MTVLLRMKMDLKNTVKDFDHVLMNDPFDPKYSWKNVNLRIKEYELYG